MNFEEGGRKILKTSFLHPRPQIIMDTDTFHWQIGRSNQAYNYEIMKIWPIDPNNAKNE